MPTGLEPALTSEALRPPEYYQAVRKQKLALSSLSLVGGKREKDKFLKAGSSTQVRNHLAEANLQAKLHSGQATKQAAITVNDYDVISMLRRDRHLTNPAVGSSKQDNMQSSYRSSIAKNSRGSHSVDNFQRTTASLNT